MYFYADLGKTGTGDGSYANQWGKDEWFTKLPGSSNDVLFLKGGATYTHDIKICSGGAGSSWLYIASQDPLEPFRINMPTYDLYLWDDVEGNGAPIVARGIFYCNNLYARTLNYCFVSANTYHLGGSLWSTENISFYTVFYKPTDPIILAHPGNVIEGSLIFVDTKIGTHMLCTRGTIRNCLSDDTSFASLTDGSWTDIGTTYGFDHGTIEPSGWDDLNLYNFGLGADAAFIPDWVPPAPVPAIRKGIHYAVRIFADGEDSWSETTDPTVGLTFGKFNFITDRPGYDGVTIIPHYGPNEISIGGVDISNTPEDVPWFEGMIQKDGFTTDANRMADVVASGSYTSDAGFGFKIRNDTLFWNYCKQNGINFTGRRVLMYVVIDDIIYQVSRGRIVNNPYDETDYNFEVQDDANLIHKVIPPLSATPTNMPDQPDSQGGDAIPVVMGDVVKSKLLKITTENEYTRLHDAVHTAYVDVQDQYITASKDYQIDVTTGMGKLKIINQILAPFPIHYFKGQYLVVSSGKNANTDKIYRISDNDASVVYDPSFLYYSTLLYLDELLITSSSPPEIMKPADFNGVYTYVNLGGSFNGNIDIWWFKISSMAIDVKASQNPNIGFILGANNLPTIWTWDDALKDYLDLSSVVQPNSAVDKIVLISNAASKDGKVQLWEKINWPLIRYGLADDGGQYWKTPGWGTHYDLVSTPAALAAVQDRLRGYHGLFAGKFPVGGGATWLTAFYRINPLPIEYDSIFCLADMNLVNFASTPNLVAIQLVTNGYDVFDNDMPLHAITGLPPGTNCKLVPSGVLFSPSPFPTTLILNLIPTIYYDPLKILADPTSYFGQKDNAIKYIIGEYLNLNNQKESVTGADFGQKMVTSPFIKTMSFHIGIAAVQGFSPVAFDVEIKQIVLIGVRSIDTLSGDLFASVRGEKTGATATDPDAETNNVYDAFVHILEDYDGIPPGLIDYGNLPDKRKDWHVGRTLTERKNSVDYLNELCSHSFVAMFPTRQGKRGLKAFDYATELNPIALHDFNVIGRDSIEGFEKTDVNQMYNNFLLQYDYDPGANKFTKAFVVANVDKFATFPAKTEVDPDGTPTWYQCFGGLLGSPNFPAAGYDESKVIWDMCRHSYEVNRIVKQAQGDISQLNWYVDRAKFDPSTTWGTGDTSSAYYLLQILAQGATLQKGLITYSIPINQLNIGLELLDVVSVKDIIFTNNEPKIGYIVSVEIISSKDQIRLQVMLLPDELQPYPPVTVGRRRLMSALAAPITQGKIN